MYKNCILQGHRLIKAQNEAGAMILTPIIVMVEDLEEDQEDPTKEAMIIETPALTAATHIIQRMRVPTKIRVYL